ncbi:MAG: hypothetical protein JWM19_3253 [Actinomycetia bacterium]|nr:hypothetical protein [Actinomycetes bacterium]
MTEAQGSLGEAPFRTPRDARDEDVPASSSPDLHQIEYRHHQTRDLSPVASSMSPESRGGWNSLIRDWVRHPHSERLSESVCYQVFSSGRAALAWRYWDQRAAERSDGSKGRPLVSRVLVGQFDVLTPEVAIALCRTGPTESIVGPLPGEVPDGASLPTVRARALTDMVRQMTPELDAEVAAQSGDPLQAVLAAALSEPGVPLAISLRENIIEKKLYEGAQYPMLWGLRRIAGPVLGPVGRNWSFSTFELPLGDTEPASLPSIVFRQMQDGSPGPRARVRKEVKVRPSASNALSPDMRYGGYLRLAGWLVEEYKDQGSDKLAALITRCCGSERSVEARLDRIHEELQKTRPRDSTDAEPPPPPPSGRRIGIGSSDPTRVLPILRVLDEDKQRPLEPGRAAQGTPGHGTEGQEQREQDAPEPATARPVAEETVGSSQILMTEVPGAEAYAGGVPAVEDHIMEPPAAVLGQRPPVNAEGETYPRPMAQPQPGEPGPDGATSGEALENDDATESSEASEFHGAREIGDTAATTFDSPDLTGTESFATEQPAALPASEVRISEREVHENSTTAQSEGKRLTAEHVMSNSGGQSAGRNQPVRLPWEEPVRDVAQGRSKQDSPPLGLPDQGPSPTVKAASLSSVDQYPETPTSYMPPASLRFATMSTLLKNLELAVGNHEGFEWVRGLVFQAVQEPLAPDERDNSWRTISNGEWYRRVCMERNFSLDELVWIFWFVVLPDVRKQETADQIARWAEDADPAMIGGLLAAARAADETREWRGMWGYVAGILAPVLAARWAEDHHMKSEWPEMAAFVPARTEKKAKGWGGSHRRR